MMISDRNVESQSNSRPEGSKSEVTRLVQRPDKNNDSQNSLPTSDHNK